MELDALHDSVVYWPYPAARVLNFLCMVHEGDSEVAVLLVICRRVMTLIVCVINVLICIRDTMLSRGRTQVRGRSSVREKDVARAYRSLRASGLV